MALSVGYRQVGFGANQETAIASSAQRARSQFSPP